MSGGERERERDGGARALISLLHSYSQGNDVALRCLIFN